MSKRSNVYVCNECGSDHTKWQGQCASCGAWNSLSELRLAGPVAGTTRRNEGYSGTHSEVQKLNEIDLLAVPRINSGISEFDRVLGGGLVPGSAILIGGNPGAGKSTLLLQVMCQLAQQVPALYVTGEESLQQVAMRANRLKLPTDSLQLYSETNVENICETARKLQPKLLVVDSIQVVHMEDVSSAPGSVSQVRESAAYLTRFAKKTNTVLLLVGHVTKEGALAGPKVLEHMIDCSIMLESTTDSRFRTLRGIKNRFGAVNEVGVFAMLEHGMKEVKNPSAIFLNRSEELAAGTVVTVIWEGTRPLLVELQALVDDSSLGNPRRVAVGLDQNRLSMLLAVLHRHGGLHVGDQDVFLNVVGGVKVVETSADLTVLLSVVSSFRNYVLPQDLIVFGEVGLTGEIRPVTNGRERLQEAAKHGFRRAIIPKSNVPKEPIPGMEIIGVAKLSDALAAI